MSERERHPMMPPPRNDRDGRRHKAEGFFKEKDRRNAAVYEQMQTERAISDAKTAKLRALRLAKEEAEREIARNTPPKVGNTGKLQGVLAEEDKSEPRRNA